MSQGGANSSSNSQNTDGSLVLLQSQTVSGVSNIDFSSGFGGYSYYILEGFNLLGTNDLGALNLQLSKDGGSTFSTTNYSQYGFFIFGGGNGAPIPTVWSCLNNLTNETIRPSSFRMYLYSFDETTFNKTMFVECTNFVPLSTVLNLQASGSWADTGVVDAIRVINTAGNFSGTIRLFGVI